MRHQESFESFFWSLKPALLLLLLLLLLLNPYSPQWGMGPLRPACFLATLSPQHPSGHWKTCADKVPNKKAALINLPFVRQCYCAKQRSEHFSVLWEMLLTCRHPDFMMTCSSTTRQPHLFSNDQMKFYFDKQITLFFSSMHITSMPQCGIQPYLMQINMKTSPRHGKFL